MKNQGWILGLVLGAAGCMASVEVVDDEPTAQTGIDHVLGPMPSANPPPVEDAGVDANPPPPVEDAGACDTCDVFGTCAPNVSCNDSSAYSPECYYFTQCAKGCFLLWAGSGTLCNAGTGHCDGFGSCSSGP